MLTDKEMKLIYEAVMVLSNATIYRLSTTKDDKTICEVDDVKDAAAEVIAFITQNDFYQLIANNEDAE
jgi:hypothetical protein